MGREAISDRQGIVLIVLFLMGSTLLMGIGGDAGKDVWIAIIIGIIISFPALIMYGKILATFPGKDLFHILEYVFGKILGKSISILYTWFAFHLGVLVLRNFGEFVSTVSLLKTPMIVIIIGLSILCIWGVINGIEVLARWGQITLAILLVLVVITVLLLIPNMDINRITPILAEGMGPVFKGAFSVFTFPFAETIVFCFVFSALKNSKSPYKVYMWGLLIGGVIVVITSFAEILVLGEVNYTELFFPSFSTVSRIDVANIIQRSEIIVSIAFMGGGFIKISICLMGACKGVAKIFELNDYRVIVIPVGLLMTNLSHLIYDNIRQMVAWPSKIWPYYAIVFQVILPIIILLVMQIRKKIWPMAKG